MIIVKVKVESPSDFKEDMWVDIIDPIDVLDGGNKVYEGIVSDINNDILTIKLLTDNSIKLTNISICPKVYRNAELISQY